MGAIKTNEKTKAVDYDQFRVISPCAYFPKIYHNCGQYSVDPWTSRDGVMFTVMILLRALALLAAKLGDKTFGFQ